MGSPDTIVLRTFRTAAERTGKTTEEVMEKVHQALHDHHGTDSVTDEQFKKAGDAMGQTPAETMNEVHQAIHAIADKEHDH